VSMKRWRNSSRNYSFEQHIAGDNQRGIRRRTDPTYQKNLCSTRTCREQRMAWGTLLRVVYQRRCSRILVSNSTSSITYADLVQLTFQPPEQFAARGTFRMNGGTLGSALSMSDAMGRLIWMQTPGSDAGSFGGFQIAAARLVLSRGCRIMCLMRRQSSA